MTDIGTLTSTEWEIMCIVPFKRLTIANWILDKQTCEHNVESGSVLCAQLCRYVIIKGECLWLIHVQNVDVVT